MAKATIPDALKADLPQTKWGKVLATTPVVMTVIATLLAGLSSGEMIRAQYDRSLAAQQQSKAGDQWGYFQAKRLRAALLLQRRKVRGKAARHQRAQQQRRLSLHVLPHTTPANARHERFGVQVKRQPRHH